MKKLELDEQARKEHENKLSAERQKRYRATIEQANINLPKGTKDKIKGMGLVPNVWMREVILKELDRLEGK